MKQINIKTKGSNYPCILKNIHKEHDISSENLTLISINIKIDSSYQSNNTRLITTMRAR